MKIDKDIRRYEVDSFGNITKVDLPSSFFSSGQLAVDYTYDKNGNWIKALLKEEGEVKYIVQKTITYK